MGGGVCRKCQTLAIDYQQFAETYLQFYYEIPQQHFTDPQNMSLWKKTTNSLCSACLNAQTLKHVVSSCNVYKDVEISLVQVQGRFTWRHNSILKTLAEYLSSIKKNCLIYADIEGFDNPSVMTGPDDRPDMIVLNNTKDKICVAELTVGFETNIAKNCKRK